MYQSNGDQSTSRPHQCSNKVYSKGPNGWYHENKTLDFSNKVWVPKNDIGRNDFQNKRQIKQEFIQKQNPQFVSSSDTKSKNINLKQHFETHFVKGKVNESKPTCAFCNFCCKLGHISLDCKIRKSNNNCNMVWVPKACTGTDTGTSKVN